MAPQISDKVRAAMERLDQAIERLEARAAGQGEPGSADDNSANTVLAERLDQVIERIESALAS